MWYKGIRFYTFLEDLNVAFYISFVIIVFFMSAKFSFFVC